LLELASVTANQISINASMKTKALPRTTRAFVEVNADQRVTEVNE
jgi:hypothetical protein